MLSGGLSRLGRRRTAGPPRRVNPRVNRLLAREARFAARGHTRSRKASWTRTPVVSERNNKLVTCRLKCFVYTLGGIELRSRFGV